jgi:hypothetical protein
MRVIPSDHQDDSRTSKEMNRKKRKRGVRWASPGNENINTLDLTIVHLNSIVLKNRVSQSRLLMSIYTPECVKIGKSRNKSCFCHIFLSVTWNIMKKKKKKSAEIDRNAHAPLQWKRTSWKEREKVLLLLLSAAVSCLLPDLSTHTHTHTHTK